MVDRGIGRCRRRMVASLAIGLLLGLGLAGCDDDGGPADSGLPSEDEVTGSASSSPPSPATPTPSVPEPPTIPDAATKGGRAGAKAFVEFYIDSVNYARHTGDVGPLQQYSHPACGGCGDLIKLYRAWYQRGGWLKDGERTIASFNRVVLTVPPHDMYVRISGIQKAGDYRERRGASIKHARQERYTLLLWLLREPDGWRVSRLDNA